MKRSLLTLLFVCIVCAAASAQTTSQRRVVWAAGQATVSVQPDVVRINVGVVTQATTAQEAAAQNATQADTVINRLRATFGAAVDIKTINYSVTPNYKRTGNEPPVLQSYTVSNTVEVTLSDLSAIGRMIDLASQSGANTIQALRFGIRDPEPHRIKVLGLAAKQAKANADAIAAGLGARTGTVLTAQEGTVYAIRTTEVRSLAGGAPQTPIETGLVDVYATVTVEVELL